ncbi:MAG: Holliday junction branch migration protein RuvA [Pseudomonadota bacterium]
MIVHLSGILLHKEPTHCVVDVGGVGYGVNVSFSTFSTLPEVGNAVKMFIHTYVREDQLVLYGFTSPEERQIFLKLIAISGIGPKIALAVLSGLPPSDLIETISAADASRLSTIPGIGNKTAQRMIIELKGKLPDNLKGSGGSPANSVASIREEAISALVHLGYTKAVAENVMIRAGIDKEVTIEEAVKAGLKELCKA